MTRYLDALEHRDGGNGETILEQSEKMDGTLVQTVCNASGREFIREISGLGEIRSYELDL